MAKGTEIYLESFAGNKPTKTKETFKTIPNHKDSTTTKFIPKSGPEAAEGFPNKNVVGDGADKPEFSQGSGNTKKATPTKLNNSRRTKLMSEKAIITNPAKSEFDRLCEEVLGPEEVELGIESPAHEGDPNGAKGDEECESCSLPDRIRNVVTELEGILAEIEGTSPEGAPEGEEGSEVPLEDAGATPGGAVREAVEAEDLGTPIVNQKSGKPDAVTGRANVVEGDASKISKGKADGKIGKPGDGNLEEQPDGVPTQGGKPTRANQVVKSKLSGKNQPMFNV